MLSLILYALAVTIYGGQSGKNLCSGLFFCHQAYVTVGTDVTARAYVTVGAATSEATYLGKVNYVNSIGEDGLMLSLQQALTVPSWQGNMPCVLGNIAVWNGMSVTSQVYGLSPSACQIYLMTLQGVIVNQQ